MHVLIHWVSCFLGRTDIEFDGMNFGTDITRISLAYGPSGVIPPPFDCTVLSVSDNTIRFSTALAGDGNQLVFRIVVGGQIAIGMVQTFTDVKLTETHNEHEHTPI